MRLLVSLLIAGAAAMTLAAPATAQPADQTVRVSGAAGGAQVLPLARGRSAYVDLPVDARDVLVSNPAVADVVARTSRRYYVVANGPGQADAVFFDASGRQILSLDIRVGQDSAALADTIHRIVPAARVQVQTVNESLILTGSVANAAEADQVVRLAQTYVPNPAQVVNMMTVTGRDQVMLRVRIVEVERSIVRQLGVNLQGVLGDQDPQYVISTNNGFAVNGGLVGGAVASFNSPAGPGGPESLLASLAAFERVGLVRTLSEPNLTSVSGEPARMLAGGEFPVPVGVDQNGQVTVQYKPFGVGLAFTPVVLSEGRISLRIATEVSELTSTGAFTYGPASNRISIPALNVRRAENTVELPSGGAMMIAGLLQERTRQTIDRIPGAGSLPILGALFRSRDFISGETELVIIVTPYIVGPTSPSSLQTPADGLIVANDAQTLLMGRLNQRYRPGAPAGGRGWMGPIGWALD